MSLRPRRPLPGARFRTALGLPRLVRRALPLAFAAAVASLPAAHAQQFGDGKDGDVPNAVGTTGAPASEDNFAAEARRELDLINRDGDVARDPVGDR